MKLHEKWQKVLKQNSTVLNKTVVNVLFNKVLGKNEKRVFYFYLKNKGTLWSVKYFLSLLAILQSIFLESLIPEKKIIHNLYTKAFPIM